MRFVADLHLHSKYSRATSREADLPGYYRWAQVKGITLLGTGDFTHPAWFAEISEALMEEDGLLRFKEPPKGSALSAGSPADSAVRFLPTAEISSIYKKKGETRKVHSLIIVPDLRAVEALNRRLSRIGNIVSDGRPILGLDPKDLLSLLLEISPDALFIPAHIWTPWFSLFGSKSGFDAIEDCFEELTPHIHALETGLSSDPPMNRRWSALDRYRLVSNSDAHSPPNLGREATLFDCGLSYQGIRTALTEGSGFLGTVEFHPEEGKYHADGHRKCGVCMDPEETLKRGEKCPVCGKPLTIGVLNRVLALSDRAAAVHPRPSEGFRYHVPLPEILAEVCGSGAGSKPVTALYERMICAFGSERAALFDAPVPDIAKAFGGLVGEAITRMREGKVMPSPGYDGEFGVISIFEPGELDRLRGQDELFAAAVPRVRKKRTESPGGAPKRRARAAADAADRAVDAEETLDPEQEAAASASSGVTFVLAGPGTGKTRVLTHWLARRIREGALGAPQDFMKPPEALAVTFTNKAASEMRKRLGALPGAAPGEPAAARARVCTFHSLCHSLWCEYRPIQSLYAGAGRTRVLSMILEPEADAAVISDRVEKYYEGMDADPALRGAVDAYRSYLEKTGAADLSGLVMTAVQRLKTEPALLARLRAHFPVIAVDELQDINPPQYELLRLLASPEYGTLPRAMLCIGDPDQSIYSFRGSDPGLFFKLRDELGARTHALASTYRSTGTLVRAAGSVMKTRPGERAALSPVRGEGAPISVYGAEDPADEGSFIARTVRRLVGGTDSVSADQARDETGGYSFDDIAVLFRTRAVRDAFLPSFMKSGIPATIAEASPLHERRPFSRLMAALRLLENPRDASSLLQLLEAGGEAARRAALVLADAPGPADIPGMLESSGCADREWRDRFGPLFTDRERLLSLIQERGISAAMDAVLEKAVVFDRGLPEVRLGEELLRDAALGFGPDLAGFLRGLSLLAVESEEAARAERVSLLTFHAAKGLEFPVVFIAGAEEGMVPMPDNVEEERRLFYVALTRGRDLVFVSHCLERNVRGDRTAREPSRFLAEIPATLKQSGILRRKKGRPEDGQLGLF